MAHKYPITRIQSLEKKFHQEDTITILISGDTKLRLTPALATRQAKKSRKKKFAKATRDFQKRRVASKRKRKKSLWDVIFG